jgi:hypothetical protein
VTSTNICGENLKRKGVLQQKERIKSGEEENFKRNAKSVQLR